MKVNAFVGFFIGVGAWAGGGEGAVGKEQIIRFNKNK